jgi:hypothetical protein
VIIDQGALLSGLARSCVDFDPVASSDQRTGQTIDVLLHPPDTLGRKAMGDQQDVQRSLVIVESRFLT